jgi:putative NADH-flavin reductase
MSANHTKKVLILGATGPTGILTVREALNHGHSVTIYARNPAKIPSDIMESPVLKESSPVQLSV